MKVKNLLLVVFFFIAVENINAQMLCIKCYDQNARVLTDTNNLIVNGGFENTTCIPNAGIFCPNSNQYGCDISNWTCTGGGIRTYARIVDTAFSKIIEGTKAVYFGNYLAYSCVTHDTSCISNIGCVVTGIPAGYPVNYNPGYGGDTGVSLKQTVNGLTIGNIYLLEFWAGGEANGYKKNGLFAVDIGFGNIFLRDPSTPADSGIGIRYVIVFTADSSSHTIKFTNWGHVGNNKCTELILDDVRLFASIEGSNLCVTSINDLPQNAIATVYPNPATNLLHLSLDKNITNGAVNIFNVMGEKVYTERLTPSPSPERIGTGPKERGEEVEINCRLAAGVYFVRVMDETRVYTGKVVIE